MSIAPPPLLVERPSSHADSSQLAVGAIATGIVAGAVELFGAHGRSAAQWTGAQLTLSLLGTSATFVVVTLLIHVVRQLLRGEQPSLARSVVAATLEGSLCAWLAFFAQGYASLGGRHPQRWLLLLVTCALVAGLAAAARKWPWAELTVSVAALLFACAALYVLDWRSTPWLRLALALIAAASGTRAAAALVPARITLGARAVGAIGLAGVVCAAVVFSRSAPARTYVYQRTAMMNTLLGVGQAAIPAWIWRSPSGHRSRPCAKRPAKQPPTMPSRLSASAPQADVLFVSLDAWRWDHAGALPKLHAELGAHVRFSRAVTPAPNTKHALPAVMRGVPAREVPFGEEVAESGVRKSAPITLASLLMRHGYRRVQIPTQRFFDPAVGITTGFEIVKANGKAVFGTHAGPPAKIERAEVIRKILKVAKRTKRPLFLWTHLMETHAPYRYPGGAGPESMAGQRRALDALDEPLAKLVREFRKLRGDRPLIVALFGDHGEEFGEHGGHHHGSSAFAELARVGFSIAAPSLPTRTIDAPVSTAALPATVLDLIGLPRAPTMSLPSLLPCLDGGACPELAETQLMKREGWVSYTDRHYRLVVGPKMQVESAFDTRRDPYDLDDLLLRNGKAPAGIVSLRAAAARYDAEHCAAAPLTEQ